MLRDGDIDVAHLWKRFRPDRRRPSILYDGKDIVRSLRGQPWRWAVRDVSFSVAAGSAVGIIGLNGSGKSTLLKLMYGVMHPTAGKVEIAGRPGALIDVDAGMHPQLTGRENIHLWGAMLGLRRPEVLARFDDIVDFADIGDALERQAKFYSSGMRMRLGFSVAVTLDPDIMIVDEVLAVGDEVFQRRCLDRLRAIQADGTTVVYVSHDLGTIAPICQRALWLEDGGIRQEGAAAEVIDEYRRASDDAMTTSESSGLTIDAEIVGIARHHTPATVQVRVTTPDPVQAALRLGLGSEWSPPVLTASTERRIDAGVTELVCEIPDLGLPGGRYRLWVGAWADTQPLVAWEPRCWVTVAGDAPGQTGGDVAVDANATWHVVGDEP